MLLGDIKITVFTCWVIHNDNKPWKHGKQRRINDSHWWRQRYECICHILIQLLCIPRRLLALTKETRNGVATSYCMKHWQSCTPLGTKSSWESMCSNKACMFTSAEMYPKLINVKQCKAMNSQNNDICVDCSIFFDSYWLACRQWRNILVSASSWLQGAMEVVSVSPYKHMTLSSRVIRIWWFVPLAEVTHTSARKRKSSTSFSVTHRNSCQLDGIIILANTRVRVPVPLFSLQADFRLSDR